MTHNTRSRRLAVRAAAWALPVLLMALAPCMSANAKKTTVPSMYMFGMAASFNDTIVHFTGIQQVNGAWIDTKNKFLLGRENYSYQLRNYMADRLQMPHRTCIVVYSQDPKKIVKKYRKMKALYTRQQSKRQQQAYDVRFLTDDDFRFEAIDMSEYVYDEADSQATAKPKKEKRRARGKQ